MNEIANKFLLTENRFLPEMNLRQSSKLDKPRFTYSPRGPFAKNKERILNFKETRDPRYIYQNKLDKGYFQHDMGCRGFKDLHRRIDSGKVLRDKAFNIAKN